MIAGISGQHIEAAGQAYTSAKAEGSLTSFADALKAAERPQTKPLGETAAMTEEAKKAAEQDRKMRDACRGFEEMFLEIMYREMRNTVPKNDLFGNSHGEKIWHSMLDSEMMKEAAKGGGLGLADMIYQQLKLSEKAVRP